MRKSFWIWLLLFYGVIVAAIITSAGKMSWYLNIPSAVMIIAPAILLSLTSFRLKEIFGFFSAAFSSSAGEEELRKALIFFEGTKKYFLCSGIIGGLTGSTAMLIGFEDTDMVAFGAGLVVITILYGVIAYVSISVPFTSAIKKRLVEAETKLTS